MSALSNLFKLQGSNNLESIEAEMLAKDRIKELPPTDNQLLEAWLTTDELAQALSTGYVLIRSKLLDGAFYKLAVDGYERDDYLEAMSQEGIRELGICMKADYRAWQTDVTRTVNWNNIDNFISKITELKISEVEYLRQKFRMPYYDHIGFNRKLEEWANFLCIPRDRINYPFPERRAYDMRPQTT